MQLPTPLMLHLQPFHSDAAVPHIHAEEVSSAGGAASRLRSKLHKAPVSQNLRFPQKPPLPSERVTITWLTWDTEQTSLPLSQHDLLLTTGSPLYL